MWPELRDAPVGPGRLRADTRRSETGQVVGRRGSSPGPGRAEGYRITDYTAFKSEYLEKSGKITIDFMLHRSYNHD